MFSDTNIKALIMCFKLGTKARECESVEPETVEPHSNRAARRYSTLFWELTTIYGILSCMSIALSDI
ncbi:hypothetical protein PAHAL_5G280600 [Panicum hallii]|uniref:Uncharacterized protein n=1 Tax=Panicum hallii TaxID=206008 RepID=A0A2T8ILI9_9POAL|nr:hypothetical protein PAHAL_5G280600 [Panicum hallii]